MLTKEEKKEVVEQYYRDGRTLRAIAADYGVSHQRIHQIVTGGPRRNKHLECIYPGLRQWIVKKDYSARELAEVTGLSQRRLYSWLSGATNPPILAIKRILEVTGMDFEEAFLLEGGCE